MTTTDLSKFGAREREMASELLSAMRVSGLPEDFEDSEVTVMFNTMSGNVFLTNSEYQVAMMNGDKLESFYSSPYGGREGYFEELKDEYIDMHPEDQEWFRELNIDYYKELLPVQTIDEEWVEEGEKYYTIGEYNEKEIYIEESDYDEYSDLENAVEWFKSKRALLVHVINDEDLEINPDDFEDDDDLLDQINKALVQSNND